MKCSNKAPNHDDIFAGAIESYYLETREGLFFAVKGLEHPPDRSIGILRYAPDPERGDRKKGGKIYRRLYHFQEQEQFIRTAFPRYLAFDPVFQTTLQSVPGSMIQRVYNPRLRFRELAQTPVRSAIEDDAFVFLSLLQNEAQVPPSSFGITGSLLICLHTEHSDLDIAVFGAKNCQSVYKTLHRLLDDPSSPELRRLDDGGTEELFAQRAADTHMAFQEFVNLEKNKVNQGRFRERTYFVRFIKEPQEADEIYGHRRYTPLGRAEITASIADDQEAIFTPCRYLLSGVRILEGPRVSNLNEIISFRGRFCEQARIGDSVRAAGTLERVENNRGDVRHRLLLGNFTEDTMVMER
jgi:uncharacterized protein